MALPRETQKYIEDVEIKFNDKGEIQGGLEELTFMQGFNFLVDDDEDKYHLAVHWNSRTSYANNNSNKDKKMLVADAIANALSVFTLLNAGEEYSYDGMVFYFQDELKKGSRYAFPIIEDKANQALCHKLQSTLSDLCSSPARNPCSLNNNGSFNKIIIKPINIYDNGATFLFDTEKLHKLNREELTTLVEGITKILNTCLKIEYKNTVQGEMRNDTVRYRGMDSPFKLITYTLPANLKPIDLKTRLLAKNFNMP